MMSANGDRDNEFIILLIGDSGVGKTSLVKRFKEDTFTPNTLPTMTIDFYTKAIELHGKTVKFQIWVAEGQGRVLSLTRSFFRHINGIIVVYDVANQASFENVKNWFRKVESNASEHVSKLLVGNKSDLTTLKVVDYSTAKDFADKLGIAFLETSAKDGTNVKQVFTTMASDIYSRVSPPISNEHTQDGSGSINLGVSVKPYGFGRCY